MRGKADAELAFDESARCEAVSSRSRVVSNADTHTKARERERERQRCLHVNAQRAVIASSRSFTSSVLLISIHRRLVERFKQFRNKANQGQGVVVEVVAIRLRGNCSLESRTLNNNGLIETYSINWRGGRK